MPKTIVISGSAGLIGAEASRYFGSEGFEIVGIDNDLRATFFGNEASTAWSAAKLKSELGSYDHRSIDIRDFNAVDRIFRERAGSIVAVIHTAAQPSHDWAAQDPVTDFGVNANGTLNLLQCYREHSPDAAFIFTSTNKVYGDRPNALPLVEEESRYELYDDQGKLSRGIDESMSVDRCLHSLFGVSKLSADLLVQEFGHYFGLNTVCFRGGCLTGGGHSGTKLHGFLSYLMKCVIEGKNYQIFGYKGKQVRDNIHSKDLIRAFAEYLKNPKRAMVYNIGGGRASNCSMQEAIKACETRVGRKLSTEYIEANRIGDHQWYVSDMTRFESDYPNWTLQFPLEKTFDEIYRGLIERREG